MDCSVYKLFCICNILALILCRWNVLLRSFSVHEVFCLRHILSVKYLSIICYNIGVYKMFCVCNIVVLKCSFLWIILSMSFSYDISLKCSVYWMLCPWNVLFMGCHVLIVLLTGCYIMTLICSFYEIMPLKFPNHGTCNRW